MSGTRRALQTHRGGGFAANATLRRSCDRATGTDFLELVTTAACVRGGAILVRYTPPPCVGPVPSPSSAGAKLMETHARLGLQRIFDHSGDTVVHTCEPGGEHTCRSCKSIAKPSMWAGGTTSRLHSATALPIQGLFATRAYLKSLVLEKGYRILATACTPHIIPQEAEHPMKNDYGVSLLTGEVAIPTRSDTMPLFFRANEIHPDTHRAALAGDSATLASLEADGILPVSLEHHCGVPSLAADPGLVYSILALSERDSFELRFVYCPGTFGRLSLPPEGAPLVGGCTLKHVGPHRQPSRSERRGKRITRTKKGACCKTPCVVKGKGTLLLPLPSARLATGVRVAQAVGAYLSANPGATVLKKKHIGLPTAKLKQYTQGSARLMLVYHARDRFWMGLCGEGTVPAVGTVQLAMTVPRDVVVPPMVEGCMG